MENVVRFTYPPTESTKALCRQAIQKPKEESRRKLLIERVKARISRARTKTETEG